MTVVTSLFKKGGGLSNTLSHFELRAGQIELVSAIAQAIDAKHHLIAEAGTGIGKTFSYLLPTLADHKQVFVSTATKHLQDQIFFKDIPIIEKVLERKISACLLKGRRNYFCHYRYESFFSSDVQLNKRQSKKATQIKAWSAKTLSGDLSEITDFIDKDTFFQKKITSTTDNCLGGNCPYFGDCFFQKAREKAKKSEIVIVNHALLMADIVLKETGFAEILPDVEVVVIDEAHHLPKIATQAFAEQVSFGQLMELTKDSLQVYQADAGDVEGFEDCLATLVTAIHSLREALSAYQTEGEIQLGKLKQLDKPYTAFKSMMIAFKSFLIAMQGLAERSSELANLFERTEMMAHRIKTVFTVSTDKPSQQAELSSDEEKIPPSAAILLWNEDYFSASRSPIHLGERFCNIMNTYADSWLFVSATLSVGGVFTFFIDSLGLSDDILTLQVDSPFDYQHNVAIHVLPNLPEPNQLLFIPALIRASLPILEKTAGRAFMLFTSYRNLHEAALLMKESDFNLFVQGDRPKSQLIDDFMQSDNAVLMGTVSFWEGVDVSGEKLSCVIIDKIPFPSPSDPMIAEQSKYLERQGRSSFAHCYIPKAATLLKQGAGRLIRSASDTGILIFGDNRLIRKSYGKQLMASMPPAKQVDSDELFEFIEKTL
ncbi:MAG: ATP-dependent DNA helicase [Ostreibacterium sp.]